MVLLAGGAVRVFTVLGLKQQCYNKKAISYSQFSILYSTPSNIFVVSPARRGTHKTLATVELRPTDPTDRPTNHRRHRVPHRTIPTISSRKPESGQTRRRSGPVRPADPHPGQNDVAGRSALGARLAVFLGSYRPPLNNHLKRTETQASEKQGNDCSMVLLLHRSFVPWLVGGVAVHSAPNVPTREMVECSIAVQSTFKHKAMDLIIFGMSGAKMRL